MANTTNRTTRIKHVFGNVLKLAIPLTLRTVTLEGGIVEVTDTDYTPSNHYPVVVQFVNGPLKYELNATIRDNYIAVVEDKGTIPVGNYAIVVLCKDNNGDPRRFKQRCVLEVVDVTADAGIEVGIEFEAQEWLLDGAIFLAIKGEDGIDGVGIESITTDETSVSGEYNQVTFHLTNGSSYTLNVRNGESTEQTLPANVVVDENYVHTDNNYTDTDKQKIESVDKLFADAEYDRISRRLNFFKHGDTMHTNPLKSIDITDFIRDSRVSSFRIVDDNLTIRLNSDGNNEEFKVPITSINANYYTKSQVDSLYSSLSSRVTPVEVIFTESNDSITSNRTINGIYTDYTNKKPIIGKYGSSVGVLLYISSQEAAFLFGDRYDKPFILRNSGSTHWGKEDLVDDSSSIVIDDAPTPESDNAVSSGSVWYYLTQRIQSVTINGTTKTPDDNGNVNFTVQGGGGYTPPQGGIPKTDLASGVQSSLDAADSAYQKPNGGIPASDLSSAVQTSLGKADTALQSSDLEGYATTDDVDDAVAALVSSAPQTLDTLNELAEALGDDPNFATTMATQLGNKVDKETGKGLSSNDYTTAEKNKLDSLENYDDSSLQTAIAGKVDKETGKSLMSDAEHTKLAGIAAGAEVNVQPNWTQTNTSADDYIKNKPTLATVATSGSYNDLSNKPTIPAAYDDTTLSGRVSALENAGFITTETDPTVPNWAKASTKPTYTAQEVGALPSTTTIPTDLGDLTNNAGYTKNTGTITGITMNGTSKGTSGVVDLGTVITAHQDISGKANASDVYSKTQADTLLAGKLSKSDVSVETQGDGTVEINVKDDTYTINLNHTHPNMAKLIVCEESDLPSTLDPATIYAQVNDADNPTEIEVLYIAGLEFAGGGVPAGTPAITKPSGTTINLGENSGSGVSKSIEIKANSHITGDLTVGLAANSDLSFDTTNLPSGVTYNSGAGTLTIAQVTAMQGVNITIVYSGSGAAEIDGGLIITGGGASAKSMKVVVAEPAPIELDGVKLTGTQWIETDYYPNPKTEFVFELTFETNSNTEVVSSNIGRVLMGCKSNSNPASYFSFYNIKNISANDHRGYIIQILNEGDVSNQNLFAASAATDKFPSASAMQKMTTPHSIMRYTVGSSSNILAFEPGGVPDSNNNDYTSTNLQKKTSTMTYPLGIGGRPSSTDAPYAKFDLTVHRLTITEDGVAVRDYVPRIKDGDVGLLDIAQNGTGLFLTSETADELVAVYSSSNS